MYELTAQVCALVLYHGTRDWYGIWVGILMTGIICGVYGPGYWLVLLGLLAANEYKTYGYVMCGVYAYYEIEYGLFRLGTSMLFIGLGCTAIVSRHWWTWLFTVVVSCVASAATSPRLESDFGSGPPWLTGTLALGVGLGAWFLQVLRPGPANRRGSEEEDARDM